MNAKLRLLAALGVAIAASATLSCNVNEYCLNCAAAGGDGGVPGDGNDGDGGDADGDGGVDAGPCVFTGAEECDNKDNDCDGHIDEGSLPGVGGACPNQTGSCAGGTMQCVAGEIKCSKAAAAESCDHNDNDCDGRTDEGDPGGGARCGTDRGECVAGTMHCNAVTGVVECQGAIGGIAPPFGVAESCDGKDNDCDDAFDEGLSALGSCGGGPGADPNAGTCQQGTLMCVGGGTICVGDVGPQFEDCDAADNDCDGDTDEDTDKLTDPNNCGTCGRVCNLPNAFESCTNGQCTIGACAPTFHDNNNSPADGCEFGPCTIQGNEVCNGVDDDCNPATTEAALTPPPNFCLTVGACAGATASCQGANGFRCSYGANVSKDASGNIVQETLCDGIDNDCDGRTDEGQPNLGQACSDNGVGVCRGTGTFQCNAANRNGPAICVITAPGTASSAEQCDAKDNDCDGNTDEGAATGNLIGQEWVAIPGGGGTQIMKYEASRPGATSTNAGTVQNFACSKQTVLPWTNVTYPQARAACQAVGARLCTESEWQSMCAQPVTSTTYPVTAPANATAHVFIEAEQAKTNATVAGRTWTTSAQQNFSGTTSLVAGPDGDNVNNQGQVPTQSARLDFDFTFTGTNDYFVWVRMLAPDGSGNSAWVGINATVPGTAQQQIGTNLLNQWVWVVSPAISVTAGTRTVSVFMREGGTFIDAISLSRDGVNPPPFDEKIWAYQNNNKTPQPTICNGDEFDTTAGGTDQDDILPTGSLPSCFANGPATADAFDMSGNVKEWTNARAVGQNPLRGGASNNEVTGLSCGLNFTLADDTFFFPNVGFRCCR